MMKTTLKTARTIKLYRLKAFGYDITVPIGSIVSNQTACGPDDAYRFWQDWGDAARALTGLPRGSLLAHDLTHYGINVPADHCEPWPV